MIVIWEPECREKVKYLEQQDRDPYFRSGDRGKTISGPDKIPQRKNWQSSSSSFDCLNPANVYQCRVPFWGKLPFIKVGTQEFCKTYRTGWSTAPKPKAQVFLRASLPPQLSLLIYPSPNLITPSPSQQGVQYRCQAKTHEACQALKPQEAIYHFGSSLKRSCQVRRKGSQTWQMNCCTTQNWHTLFFVTRVCVFFPMLLSFVCEIRSSTIKQQH